jgi:GTP-binding protein HflX
VNTVLKEIGVSHKPVILVFNKTDTVSEEYINKIRSKYRKSVQISALKKIGFDDLFQRIKKIIEKKFSTLKVKIPYTENKLLSNLHDSFKIIKTDYQDDGVILTLEADENRFKPLEKYIYKGPTKKIARIS